MSDPKLDVLTVCLGIAGRKFLSRTKFGVWWLFVAVHTTFVPRMAPLVKVESSLRIKPIIIYFIDD
jgi:hypothetical protein